MTNAAMAGKEMPATSKSWWRDADSAVWPFAALIVLIAAQLSFAFTRAINWDEFFFYHQVADFAEGRLTSPLQTLNTRIFFWLPGLFDSNIDHIVTARVTMLAFEIVTLWSLYLIAQRFTDNITALFVPLLYLSAGYVLQHGNSFRVDPMATAALTGALAVMARSRLDWRAIAGFGLLAAFGTMVTIKVILYFPAFAGLAVFRLMKSDWSRSQFIRLVACVACAVLFFALMFLWHSSSVTAERSNIAASTGLFSSSISWMFFIGLPAYWTMAIKAMMLAPIFTLAVVAAPILIWRSDRSRAEKIALTGFLLPVLTPFYYMNTAAYFYAFILAPVALGCIPALVWARRRFAPMILTSALASIALGVFLVDNRTIIDRQRQLEANIREIFPQPVTYIDHNYMMGSWPKGNKFMTPWGMNMYRENGVPEYTQALEADVVPLVIGNWWTLRVMFLEGDDTLLVAEDNESMGNSYIEFAPFIWIAGKRLPAGMAADNALFQVPGPYTVRDAPVIINGKALQPGDVIQLDRTNYQLEVPGAQDARLIWGDNLQPPSNPLEPGPLYAGF